MPLDRRGVAVVLAKGRTHNAMCRHVPAECGVDPRLVAANLNAAMIAMLPGCDCARSALRLCSHDEIRLSMKAKRSCTETCMSMRGAARRRRGGALRWRIGVCAC